MRAAANASRFFWKNPLNPLSETPAGKAAAAGLDMFERITRRYGKPEFGIDQVSTAHGEFTAWKSTSFGQSHSAIFCISERPISATDRLISPRC